MAILTFPGNDPRRASAVRSAVAARCESLGLCAPAAARCIGRAFALLRTGASAGWSIAEGVKLAKRIASAGQRDFGGAA